MAGDAKKALFSRRPRAHRPRVLVPELLVDVASLLHLGPAQLGPDPRRRQLRRGRVVVGGRHGLGLDLGAVDAVHEEVALHAEGHPVFVRPGGAFLDSSKKRGAGGVRERARTQTTTTARRSLSLSLSVSLRKNTNS
jgi:hypothetical protein